MSWRDDLKQSADAHLDELKELLRIPSVSTDPARQLDVRRAAEWIARRLTTAGVPDVQITSNEGHPAVIGRWVVDDELPTVLIYGHYDVQPEEPVELWTTPPFEPTIEGDILYARGSSDMKGNLLTAVQGVEACARNHGGQPPVNVKFVFEGEEEIGSPHFAQILREHHDFLKADAVVSADGAQLGQDTPSLSVSLKGMKPCQINLRTATTDLHSGSFGAWVPNAVQSLVQLAATFHDENGRVMVDGFYDRVRGLTDDERAEIAAVGMDEVAEAEKLGVSSLWGEAGYTARERQWARPTLDMNGIWGGFQGEGTKTVTPCEAHLKVSCRLVPDQDPNEIVNMIRAHCEKHCPPGTTIEVVPADGAARPYVINRSDPIFGAVKDVLTELYGKEPLITRNGGTVPATGIFQDEFGVETLAMAWAAPDSRAHAPNEWYSVSAYLLGREAYAMLLERLAAAR